MDDHESKFWPVVQGVKGVYCAALVMISFLYPAQPNQPRWQGAVRVTAPSALLLALLAVGQLWPSLLFGDLCVRRSVLLLPRINGGLYRRGKSGKSFRLL
jgi:hypothetical protein